MLFLLALVSAVHQSTHAAPMLVNAVPGALFTSSTSPDAGCSCPNTRTIWDIVWSCAATLFACSWVSVHPNIPAPGKKWWQVALLRLELMIWTIIAPEMMIFWAMRQWFGARTLAARYNDNNWTKTHGYFIQMGGFVLYRGSRRAGVLSPEKMEDLLKQRLIEFPTITEEEIQDRSKGDGLSKMLVIGQTSWFIAQCITRRAQGLIMTQLELATLAFAALNGFMYFFWWNKPLDVRSTVPVHFFDEPIPEKEVPNDDIPLANVHLPIVASEHKPAQSAVHYGNFAIGFITKVLFQWPWHAILTIMYRLNDMVGSDGPSTTTEDNQGTVHPFYALKTSGKGTDVSDRVLPAASIIGIIFGGIHCAGWDFLFPAHAEAVVWQVASVIITAWPGFALLSMILDALSKQTETFWLKKFFEDFGPMLLFIVMVSLPIYIIARLVLLMEVLITLHNLPPGALLEVQWTSFLPHI